MQHEQFLLHAEIEQRHWWFAARRKIVRRLAAAVVPPSPETLVIDVGCGTGANTAALTRGYRCVGIDTSQEAIELAGHRFPSVEFLAGEAPAALGELARQAKMFLLLDVLEHVPDDFALFSQLLWAASPGCHFLVTVPADGTLWSRHDESFGHYRRYDRARLERVWAGLPVRSRLISYFNTLLYWPIRAIRAWNRFRRQSSGLAGTDFWTPVAPVNALLESLFAAEAGALLAVLQGRRRQGFMRGASLVAVLRREG